MRLRSAVGSMCLLVALACTASCASCTSSIPGPPKTASGAPALPIDSPACAVHQPVTLHALASDPDSGSHCPNASCGTNGFWLGEGVPFHRIRLDGAPNEAGLFVTAFADSKGNKLTLDAQGAELRGVDSSGNVVTGNGLLHAVITLGSTMPISGQNDGHLFSYRLEITNVSQERFFAEPACPAGTACSAPANATEYSFTAVADDGCQVMTCEPSLASATGAPNITGTAVVFRGDDFDEKFTVTRPDPSTTAGNFFNLACLDTVLAKVHLLRRTTASLRLPTDPPPTPVVAQQEIDAEQALVRLFTADYCGVGVPFTRDGVPLNLSFAGGPAPTSASGYQKQASDSIDAVWDAHGAVCLGSPRWARVTTDDAAWSTQQAAVGRGATSAAPTCPSPTTAPLSPADDLASKISNACCLVGHPLPACATFGPAPTVSRPFVSTGTMVSFNPP